MALRGVRVHITGIVQGVGFRPFVYGLADRLELKGWVRNTSAGVDIEVDGTQKELETFIDSLQVETPPLSRIDTFQFDWIPANGFSTFEIVHSEGKSGDFIPISPDVSICQDCMSELLDPNDRRYRYPFINCTNCGPRFTIIKDIPYDRPKTTMGSFEMCPACQAEYEDPLDRRFHAQPVACPDCGPHVWLESLNDKTQVLLHQDSAIQLARKSLAAGRILAIKGLGGFHLACDATNQQAVGELRQRKLRVDKPFALMMPNLEVALEHCFVTPAEQEQLLSRQRPIVLLKKRPGSPIAGTVAPNQSTLGVMLPYTPLHYLLLEPETGWPDSLVMTSGNLSEEPIATGNEEARQRLADLADEFLLHNRDIHIRCDDSVLRVLDFESGDNPPDKSSLSSFQYPLRRARGYAPNPVQLLWDMPPLLAAGTELKNTFCLTRGQYAFISHHIGDLENYETLQAFEEGISHYERLFRIEPQAIGYDLHPDYLATRYALERAQNESLPSIGVQHHHAHLASCLAENQHPGDRQVIGLILDGNGYGEDGAVWGGEILLGDYRQYERLYHLAYVPLPGGDLSIREPWRTALAHLHRAGLDWEPDLFPVSYAEELKTPEWDALDILKQQIESGVNSPQTSSMGRLFDAVAALLGVRQAVNYEAQAAIELEFLVDQSEINVYPFEVHEQVLDPAPMLAAILNDLRAGAPVPVIAARFHNTIADLMQRICIQIRSETNIDEVALSGGVWQNMTLLSKTVSKLYEHGFIAYLHHQVPANDGGISLGQAAVALHKLKL
jgi:hydrogenase maturation protein HypF